MEKPAESPCPPEPPHFRRRAQMNRLQLIGVGLLAVLPLTALTGVLGDDERRAGVHSGPLHLDARFPHSMRYGTSSALEVRLENRGATAIERVRVRLDDAYLSQFSRIRFAPAPVLLGDGFAEFELTDLQPGDARRIVLSVDADRYGKHRGRISAIPAGTAPLELVISTLVLP